MNEYNSQLVDRLNGLLKYLQASYEAGRKMSNAVKGFERELFITGFLSQVFPPHYRFASGEITDVDAHTSGQIDIVLEFPEGFSFPIFSQGPRLFLAESAATAIEIKSNLVNQWQQVLDKAGQLTQVRRRYAITAYEEELKDNPTTATALNLTLLTAEERIRPAARIPFRVVGFEGWKDVVALKDKIKLSNIDSVFVIEHPSFFVSAETEAEGPAALVMFLEQLESDIRNTASKLPVIRNYSHGLIPKQAASS